MTPWRTSIASSAPRCRPIRSRCAPIFATRPSRINGYYAMRKPRRNIEKYAKIADHAAGGDALTALASRIPRQSSTDGEALSGTVDPPRRRVAGFISALIEEFGDEWGNKWMFHYRWAREVDQICSAGRIARMRAPQASEDGARQVRKPGPRPHGRPGLVRRLQFADRVADRDRLSGDADAARRPSGEPALFVRRAAGLWRFRPVGAVL